MAIRIPRYESRNLATRVGNVDPGFVQPLINRAGQDAASSTMQSLLDSGKQLGDVAIKQYVSSETARVSEALQDYRNQLADEQARYSKENQGQNALGAGEHFDAFARDTAAPLAEKFSGKFRNMFMQDAAAYGLRFKEHGQAYAQQQEHLWKRSQWEGDVAQTMDTIAQDPGNTAFVQTSLQNLKGRYAEMFPGMDPRAMDADLNHKVAGITIDSFLAKDQVGQARNAFNQYRDILGAAAPQFESRINTKGRELEARARIDAARAETEALKGKVDAFNSNTAGMSDAEKLDVLDKTYGGDAKNKKVYRAILDDVAYEAGAKADLRNKSQAIRLRGIEDSLTEAAKGTPEESFQKTREVVQGLPLEDRPKALKIADNLRAANMYDDGKITQDDPLAKSELATRLASGEDVSVDAEYGNRLSKVTREKYKSEAFRSALPSVKTAFEVEAATWMGANKFQAKSALGKGGVGALWTRFLDQTNADEKKDPARLRQEARDFFKSVTLEAGFFGRDKKTIQGLQNIYLDKYDDARPAQGTPEYDHAVQTLKQAGKKPEGMFGRYSDKQLSTAYRLLLQSSPDAGGGE